jgi:hypothetical protein
MGHEIGTATAHGIENADHPTAAAPADATSLRPATDGDINARERRLLAATPLHAITALYGEAGLRERFAIEIASFLGACPVSVDLARSGALGSAGILS